MMRAEMTAGGTGQEEAVRILLILRTLPDLLFLCTQASAVVCISSSFFGFNFFFVIIFSRLDYIDQNRFKRIYL